MTNQNYGLLCYDKSFNLGDEVQSIAALQYLPTTNSLVDRDTNNIKFLSNTSSSMDIKIIYNGWFDGQYCTFPPPNIINPLFISFHINETDHTNDSMYNILDDMKQPLKPIVSNISYLKQHEPIGCRDLHTMNMLDKNGIKTYFSGCLTLTLQNKFTNRSEDILVIDSHILAPKIYNSVIPETIRKKAKYYSQAIKEQLPHNEKMKLAQEHLDRLAKAKLVITSRLHTALPCLAYGTPVIFIHDNLSDVRFSGLLKFMKSYTTGDKLDVDLDTYKNPDSNELKTVINNLRNNVTQWIKQSNIPKLIKPCLQDSVISNGYSIFSVCMNRNNHLDQSLPTWLSADPNEIVIVDWGSEPSIKPIIDKYNSSGKIKLITVNNVKKWVLSKSYNLAAQFTKYTNILKVDCDSLVNENFFTYHNLEKTNIFFAGDWKKARNENERHTNGIVYMKRSEFFKIGGYNEFIITYGYDDCDLYNRLEKNNKRMLINLDCVSHIPHNNDDRIVNQTLAQKTRLDIEIEKNRLIAELGIWNGNFAYFDIVQKSKYEYIAEYYYSVQLGDEMTAKLLEKAAKNREYAMNQQKPKKKFYINVKNGLGNRLRAFASAYVIAQATNRQLVLIWTPDFHCEAKFGDLFKTNYLLKDVTILENDKTIFTEDITQYKINENDNIVKNKIIYNYMSSKDTYIDDTSPYDIYVSSACVLKNNNTNWTKEALVLKQLEPVDNINNLILKYAKEFDISNTIGVHIRMGQETSTAQYENISDYSDAAKKSVTKWRTSSHWSVFVREMKRIMKENPNQKFFVCCDNEDIYGNILKEINNIFYIKKSVYDRSFEQIISGLIDVILLSRTKHILGSNWSSFTELAHRLSGKQLTLAGVNFM